MPGIVFGPGVSGECHTASLGHLGGHGAEGVNR